MNWQESIEQVTDTDTLEKIITIATTRKAELSRSSREGFTFEFEHTSDPRKGIPYVARLKWSESDKDIDREFFELEREYGRKQVTVSGTYEAKVGDIIEHREGGSWKNDYRYWSIVTDTGELKQVSHIYDSADKAKVKRYLRGEITADELVG